jgi:hypothetical protein
MNRRLFIKNTGLSLAATFSLLLFFSISCSVEKRKAESDAQSSDSQKADTCDFTNDYKELTAEWLKELKITEFTWRENLHGALIAQGEDTVFISQGGCGPFGISVDLWMRTPAPDITDSTFWISKALELADKYQMTDYSEIIRKGKLRRTEIDAFNVWYEVFPENQAENEVFEGIAVVLEKDFKRLSMSKYFN